MKRVSEVFLGEFADARSAVVQRCDDKPANRDGINENYTEHWPRLRERMDLVVLALGNSKMREVWCGRLLDEIPSLEHEGLYRFVVDRFVKVGTHALGLVSDAVFYGNKGGGGSRVLVYMRKSPAHSRARAQSPDLIGENVQRLVWVRKNASLFRDPVWRHWNGKCAVLGHSCNGLLIASHIKPWSKSSAREKVDLNNGLLLSAAIDKLFDRGLISFDDNGLMLRSKKLTSATAKAFGLSKNMHIDADLLTTDMRCYLEEHRSRYNIPPLSILTAESGRA
jgi:hypothetical protein